jgi:hypothetical protein
MHLKSRKRDESSWDAEYLKEMDFVTVTEAFRGPSVTTESIDGEPPLSYKTKGRRWYSE